jgi:catechol 1,2-dioxygenase
MIVRGMFTTDKDGHFAFRSVKPAGYPIPIEGPVGELLHAAKRHNYRPAHVHFLIAKEGYKTLISQIYVNDDDKLETDSQFGVTRALIGDYVRHDGAAPAPDVEGPWYSLDQTFVMERGKSRLPTPPIR